MKGVVPILAAWSHLLACTDIPIKKVEINPRGLIVDARRTLPGGRERRASFAVTHEIIDEAPPGIIADRLRELIAFLRESDEPTDAPPGTHHYNIRPAQARVPGAFATAAMVNCCLCGKNIDSMGGPGAGQLCLACGGELINGRAIGSSTVEP